MSCDHCFAFLHMFVIDNAITRALPKTVSSGKESMRWKQIFLTTGDYHGLWLCHIRSFLEYPHSGQNVLPLFSGVCSDYGIDSAEACRWRRLVLIPLLDGTAMDFWSQGFEGFEPRVQRDWYHGTMELILLYLQGTRPTVIRPLPAFQQLRRHANIYVHPLLC